MFPLGPPLHLWLRFLLLSADHICGRPGWARQVPLASPGEARWAGGRALSAGLLQTVLVWGEAQLGRDGEADILAKAHRDADVQAFQVAFFDEAR